MRPHPNANTCARWVTGGKGKLNYQHTLGTRDRETLPSHTYLHMHARARTHAYSDAIYVMAAPDTNLIISPAHTTHVRRTRTLTRERLWGECNHARQQYHPLTLSNNGFHGRGVRAGQWALPSWVCYYV